MERSLAKEGSVPDDLSEQQMMNRWLATNFEILRSGNKDNFITLLCWQE
jgi:uncharacterized protein YdeI (YjbR/CyaY-like superfamily)